MDILPFFLSEVVSLAEQGDNIGTRETIFAQVLLFYLRKFDFHLEREKGNKFYFFAFSPLL